MGKLPLSVSGTYLKTACVIISPELNQSDANNYCISQGMKLFVIDTAATQKILQNALLQVLSGPWVLRIEGLRDEKGDNKWYYSSPVGKTPAFAGLDWITSADTLTGLNTLVITNMAYPMMKYLPYLKIDGLSPTDLFNTICEYV